MEIFYKDIVGLPVLRGASRPICDVRGLVIDPKDGKLAAVELSVWKDAIIVPMDLLKLNKQYLRVSEGCEVMKMDEIVRVERIVNKGFYIKDCAVEAKNGVSLGRVNDFSIDNKAMSLKRLYVSKNVLGLLYYEKRIIDWKDIVEILPGKIVVLESVAMIKEQQKTPQIAAGL